MRNPKWTRQTRSRGKKNTQLVVPTIPDIGSPIEPEPYVPDAEPALPTVIASELCGAIPPESAPHYPTPVHSTEVDSEDCHPDLEFALPIPIPEATPSHIMEIGDVKVEEKESSHPTHVNPEFCGAAPEKKEPHDPTLAYPTFVYPMDCDTDTMGELPPPLILPTKIKGVVGC